jgi:hypothetical protein
MADNPFDPEDGGIPPEDTFRRRWMVRAGAPGYGLDAGAIREQKERAEDIRPEGGAFDYFDPKFAGGPSSPKLSQDIEEQRGMTYPELDLQAKFQKSRGMGGLYPEYVPGPPTSFYPQDVPDRPLDPGLGKGLPTDTSPGGLRQWAVEDEYMNPPRHLYNTPLDSVHDANSYLAWAAKGGKVPEDSEEDYDLRGYYKAGGKLGKDTPLPDTFSKPSHPAFSENSRYSGPGQEGGKWVQDRKGHYIAFRVGPANLAHNTPEELQKYFDESHPGVRLVFPPGTEGAPASFEERFPRNVIMEKR